VASTIKGDKARPKTAKVVEETKTVSLISGGTTTEDGLKRTEAARSVRKLEELKKKVEDEKRAEMKRQACRFLLINGACRYGDKCFYSHDLSTSVGPSGSFRGLRGGRGGRGGIDIRGGRGGRGGFGIRGGRGGRGGFGIRGGRGGRGGGYIADHDSDGEPYFGPDLSAREGEASMAWGDMFDRPARDIPRPDPRRRMKEEIKQRPVKRDQDRAVQNENDA
jgi:hypothetical protein